jgi:hypothetical protein
MSQLRAIDQDTPPEPTPPPAGLSIPRLLVTPADGAPYEVQALNPDLLRFEDTAARHKWAGPSVAPFRWLTFLAWAASKRTRLTELTWEDFAATTQQVENLNREDTTATPTQPGADPG